MKTVTKTAFANLRQNKGRNILAGIAIILTTVLIYTILTIGFGSIKLQKAAVNELYPTFHVMYRDVSENNLQALKKHAKIEKLGERSDIAQTEIKDTTIIYIYLDEAGFELCNLKLTEGNLPVKVDEIAVSRTVLKILGENAKLGDYIKIPYQVYEAEGIGKEQSGTFRISGILPDIDTGDTGSDKKMYSLLVSQEFMKEKIPTLEWSYRIMCRIAGANQMTTDKIEKEGKEIASNFGIAELNVVFNTEYLMFNYTDPTIYAGIIAIILIVILAGFLTIYSIYYVTMIHKVQEYGKLKALGATKKQIRQMVFREGMLVTCMAVPIGLIIGMLISRFCFMFLMDTVSDTNTLSKTVMKLLNEGKVSLFQPWIIAVVIGICFFTVTLSLLKPMRAAGKISAIEAMRYDNEPKSRRKNRKGYANLNLLRLTKVNLSRNRKRTVITVITLGATGILYMVIATFLSCANPTGYAREEYLADYRISIDSESGNQMHPERDWKNIQQNNPLNDAFEQQVRKVKGVKKIQKIQSVTGTLKDFDYGGDPWTTSVMGLGDEFAKVMEASQITGSSSYQELLKGNKILLSHTFLHWFPDTKVGDIVNIAFENGDEIVQKQFEIGAIIDWPYTATQFADFILPTKVLEIICNNNVIYNYEITTDNNKNVEAELRNLTNSTEYLMLESYQDKVKEYKNNMSMMSKAGYVFIVILAGIGVMNLINTMINSVYIRKRELGIMQAMGMSDRQLIKMLQLEGLFYTIGTLIVALGIGNAAGYLVFLKAKAASILGVTKYHYPSTQTILLILTVFVLQMLLSILISRSFNKQSLIDRVRFSD